MFKNFLLLGLLVSCGTDSKSPKEITPPQPEKTETRTECWEELKCFDVWVETRRGRCLKKACSKVEVCQTEEVPVGL